MNEPPIGYPAASELRLLEIAGRINMSDLKVYFERFDVISTKSITTSNSFISPWSWSFYLGGNRNYIGNDTFPMSFQAIAGSGKAVESGMLGKTYFMVTGSIFAGDAFSNTVAVGPGVESGLLKSFSNGYYVNIIGAMSYLANGDSKLIKKAEITSGWQIYRNHSVAVSGKIERVNNSSTFNEISTNWQFFY